MPARPILAGLAVAALGAPVQAFVIDGGWPGPTIEMKLELDAPAATVSLPPGGLSDGSPSWNAAIEPALLEWNTHMARSRFTFTRETDTPNARNNGRNDVFFASTVYGQPFGTRTLAVALSARAGVSGLRFTEADVIFNTAITWDSYRGPLRAATDIRRVALHEFGHVLGLDHPDQAQPAQAVAAIMNSTIGNNSALQPDDIAAVARLYAAGMTVPAITTPLVGLSLLEGGNGELIVGVDGVLAPPPSDIFQYGWVFRPPGGATEPLFTIPDGFLKLGAAQLDDRGAYTVFVETPLGEAASNTVNVAVTAVPRAPATRLANLSTRGLAGGGQDALIVGFVVGGEAPRRVLLRGVGAALRGAPFNLPTAIADPGLTLRGASGALLAGNEDWGDTDRPALEAAFAGAGAFPLGDGSADAALLATLPPGSYTAAVTPRDGVTGIALVEVYDLDGGGAGPGRLVNLSTRGRVGIGGDILIAGLVIAGPGPRTYLLRAVGDTLATFGVTGFLDDPTLELYAADGALLRKTDDWDSPAFLQPRLSEAFADVGAFPFVDRQESALLLTLEPGAYTLHLAGFEGSTGVALIEVYEVDL